MERKTILLLAAGFSAALVLDTLSKVWAERALTPGQPLPIIGDVFQFTLGFNSGVAFGIFADGGVLTLLLTGIVIAGLGIWFLKALRSGELPIASALALGFILGGALGNFTDRFGDGRVTDFLDVGIGALRWPTFNLADSFVFVGVVLLLIVALSDKRAKGVELEKADAI